MIRHLVERKSAPWRCSVPGPPYRAALFVRAVARLASGEEVEDLLFLTRLPAERVDVRLATLYLSVLGPNGQPVADLTAQELQVLENGEMRPVKSADTVENLPSRWRCFWTPRAPWDEGFSWPRTAPRDF